MSKLSGLRQTDTDIDLAGGTALTANQSHYDTFAADRTLTFSASLSLGGPATTLKAVVTAPMTLAFPSSYREGSPTNPTTSVALVAGYYEFSWINTHGQVWLADSLDDATVAGRAMTQLATPGAASIPRINTDGTVSERTAAQTLGDIGAAAAGAVGSSGITMSTGKLLGRTSANAGAPEEITIGGGLNMAAGTLTATGGGGGSVDDTAFASTWNGVTTTAPSKNAVWDAFGGEVNYPLSAYAAGTAYALTNSSALVHLGTTDPTKVLDKVGTYEMCAGATLKYNAATFAANQTVTLKLRRTNNTAADLTAATTTQTLRILTTTTDSAGQVRIPTTFYTTANSDDSVSLYGVVSVAPSAGSLDVTEAWITALKIYGQGTGGGSPPPTYLVNEDCEGTGTPAGWTNYGTVDWDNTANAISGAQSVYVNGLGTTFSNTHIAFTAASTIYVKVRYKKVTAGSALVGNIALYNDTGSTLLAGLRANTASVNESVYLNANAGDSSASATVMTPGSSWYVWLTFVSAGTCELAMSASNSKPSVDGSGNVYITKTGASGSAGWLQLQQADGTASYDEIQVSGSPIA